MSQRIDVPIADASALIRATKTFVVEILRRLPQAWQPAAARFVNRVWRGFSRV